MSANASIRACAALRVSPDTGGLAALIAVISRAPVTSSASPRMWVSPSKVGEKVIPRFS